MSDEKKKAYIVTAKRGIAGRENCVAGSVVELTDAEYNSNLWKSRVQPQQLEVATPSAEAKNDGKKTATR